MSNFREENVSFKGEFLLKGTFTIPNGLENSYPAVLIIPGTGQGDRDGNIAKKKIHLNLYKDLAETITNMGFVTLRYDKRGVGESEGEYIKTGMWDLVSDAIAALNFLKNHPSVNREKVFVLGHSEGAMLTTILSSRETIAGCILLSGAAETLEEATKRQREIAYQTLNSMPGIKGKLIHFFKVTEKAEKKNQKLFKKLIKSDQDVVRIQFVPINAKWFREHLAHNVINDLKRITCPILAVTGSRDVQANPDRVYDVPKYVKGMSECIVINDMNHILKKQNSDISILKLIKYYKSQTNEPIHLELVNVLEKWLNENN